MATSIKEILEAKLQKALNGLPRVIGNEAVTWSQERFIEQNWIGQGIEPWQPRKSETKTSAGRKILIQSGRLWASIGIIDIGINSVTIGTNVPYAAVHNYGGIISQAARSERFTRNRKISGINKGQFKKGIKPGRGFTFNARIINMPRRQFIGNSPAMVQRLIEVAQAYIIQQMQ